MVYVMCMLLITIEKELNYGIGVFLISLKFIGCLLGISIWYNIEMINQEVWHTHGKEMNYFFGINLKENLI